MNGKGDGYCTKIATQVILIVSHEPPGATELDPNFYLYASRAPDKG